MFDYEKKKHLWWLLTASCHILEETSDIFPVIDRVLHLNYGHVTEGISEKNKNKLALMGLLHDAAFGYGWVLFNLFWDLKMLEMFVLPTYNMYLD